MTVISGVVGKDGVVIGADRMASNCHHKVDSGPKIRSREGWAYANTGDVREIQIFEAFTKGRKVESRADVLKLAEEFYKEMSSKGLGTGDKNGLPSFNSSFLIAVPDGLFQIESNFGVFEYKNYHAAGIGYQYALGVMHAGYAKESPESLVAMAIEAANALNTHCGGGPDIVKVCKAKKEVLSVIVEKVSGEGAGE